MVRTAIAVVLATAFATGCMRVKPHQRQTLARPDMVIGADAEIRGGESHARSYREGSSGGGEAKAGGCGCN